VSKRLGSYATSCSRKGDEIRRHVAVDALRQFCQFCESVTHEKRRHLASKALPVRSHFSANPRTDCYIVSISSEEPVAPLFRIQNVVCTLSSNWSPLFPNIAILATRFSAAREPHTHNFGNY
jgi:hypothetical protein